MVIQCKKISAMKVTNTRRDCHCRIHCNLGEDRSIRPWNERPKFPTMEGIRHGKVAAITRIHRPHGTKSVLRREMGSRVDKKRGVESFRGVKWTRKNERLNGERRVLVLKQKKSEKGTRNIVG